jgi:hypothetical protein
LVTTAAKPATGVTAPSNAAEPAEIALHVSAHVTKLTTPTAVKPASLPSHPNTNRDISQPNQLTTAEGGVRSGLDPPQLNDGRRVDGSNKQQHKRENKQRRINLQEEQPEQSYWTCHQGQFSIPTPVEAPTTWRNEMCPSGLALHHPAAGTLLEYASGGCPALTDKPWTKEQMLEAVEKGPHASALQPDAINQLVEELAEKVRMGQARIVLWDDIKDNPPPQLKISPLAMIPHKSRKFRAILDLSFRLRLKDGSHLPSVNEGTTLNAPVGAIDQMGHALSRIIHVFAEVGNEAKVFMAKYDIKDGFWRLDCAEGEEWNLPTCCHNMQESPLGSSYQPHSRWDGSNPQLIFAQRQKLEEMWHNSMWKHQLECCHSINSSTTQ